MISTASLRWTKRILMTTVGVLVCSFSVGMFNLAAFGVDPFQCFAQGSHGLLGSGLSYGTFYLLLSLVFLAVVWFWDRAAVGVATFINMFLTGYIVDASYDFLVTVLPSPDLVARGLLLAAAVVIMCFGSALYYTADLGVSVYDAIALKLAKLRFRVFGRVAPFQWIRVGCDLICVILGTLMGKLPGLGTLITAFFMGPLISLFNHRLAEPFLYGKAGKTPAA